MAMSQDKNIPRPIAPYSPGVLAGNTLYISGQIPINPANGEMVTGDIKEQVRQVMENLGAVLSAHGFTYQDLVKCTIFMTDMDNYAAINEAYGSFFKDSYPAREAIQVVRLPKNAEVEISGIAVKH
jgi:2-iminobutanoate/2-iminopropanoate deaminase